MAKGTIGSVQNRDALSAARIGQQIPPLSTSFSLTTSSPGPVQPGAECNGHDISPPPKKRRKVTYRESLSSALGHCSECEDVPEIPEEDLPELQRLWSRARVSMARDLQTPASSIASLSKNLGTYTGRIFKHRSIRYRQSPNHDVLFIADVKANEVQYKGDLVLEDENEGTADTLDRVIESLNYRLANERMWEADLYYPQFCLQAQEVPAGSMLDPPTAIRLVQHPMKTILRLPGAAQPYYTSFPPIVSAVDRRLTEDDTNNPPPWTIPFREGKVVNDIVYTINDPNFWSSLLKRKPREQVRAKVAGYNLYPDSNDMLPYLLVEDKRHEGLINSGLDYAKAYLILIAASILHQRLKLRAIGKMRTTLKSPGLVVHCLVMAGGEAHYLRVGLRGPASVVLDSADIYLVRYEGEVRGVFDLTRWKHRNHLKSLLRTIHTFGSGIHHDMQKEEVVNALSALNSEADDLESISSTNGATRSRNIMSNDTAFHCVPASDGEGDYVIEYTDMTINSQADDELVASEIRPGPRELNDSEASFGYPASSSAGNERLAGERSGRSAIHHGSQKLQTNLPRRSLRHATRQNEENDET